MEQNIDDIRVLKCADCARSDSLVTGVRPDARLAIPADALAGFPAGVDSGGLSRRRLLRNGIAGVAAVYGASQLSWGSVWESIAAASAEPMQHSLVVIYLNGGNDGLNCFVPLAQYSAYQSLRANIARVQGPSGGGTVGTTLMPGPNPMQLAFANPLVAGTGNNGDTKGFDTLYGDGTGGAGSDLAVFPAADYFPPNLSHFESRDYWFAGALSALPTGWIGRWLDRYGSPSNPLQAVSIDSSLSKQIRTASAPVAALDGLGGAAFSVPGVDSSTANPNAEVAKLAAVPVGAGNDALNRARGTYGLTVQVSSEVSSLKIGPNAAGYPPNTDLSSKLQLAATLLGAGLGTRFITIDWGGFDTHGDQVKSQDPQLAVLSRALAAFKADLGARGVEQNVLTLVFSEFGRRVQSNDSLGTDHGAGGAMLVSGSAVRGGVAGEHPGVASLDQDGDLVVKTDFRTVYQALIAEWLGGDPAAILPGGSFPGIQRADGGTQLLK